MITLWFLGFLDGYAGHVRRAIPELDNIPGGGPLVPHSYRDGEWDGLWQRIEERAS